MKKILILCTLFIFYGCSMNQEQESVETKTNSGNVTKIETNSGTIANTETNTGNSIATTEQKELTSLTKKEVYELVKDYDNSSKIFDRKNQIAPYSTTYAKKNRVSNEKIKDIDYIKNDPFLNQELKKFLKEIGLGFIYNLEDLGGTEELTIKSCEKILNNLNGEVSNCKFFIDGGGQPFSIDVLLLNQEYLYLNISDFVSNLGYDKYGIFIYDISNGKLKEFDEDNIGNGSIYLFDNNLYFLSVSELTYIFNLNESLLYDYSEKNINKSNKWFLDIQDGNLIVESVLEDIKINLGEFEEKLPNGESFFDYRYKFFETNNNNTKFAFIIKSGDDYSTETITYGDFKSNGLVESKTFTTKNGDSGFGPCFPFANSSIYFIDDLIITTSGCGMLLELTVFDTNNEKFLYRSDYIDMSYFKDYE